MTEIASADALRERAATHTIAAGWWEHGVLLALLRRNTAWWLVLWRCDGPPVAQDVERARHAFGIPAATAAQPPQANGWCGSVGPRAVQTHNSST